MGKSIKKAYPPKKNNTKGKNKPNRKQQGKKRKTPKKKTKGKKRSTKKPLVFGHVYSSQCGHCINMQQEWDNMCNEVKDIKLRDIGNNYEDEVTSLNTEYNTDLKYEGFPTIFKIIKRDTPVQYYYGERTSPSMKNWLYT